MRLRDVLRITLPRSEPDGRPDGRLSPAAEAGERLQVHLSKLVNGPGSGEQS